MQTNVLKFWILANCSVVVEILTSSENLRVHAFAEKHQKLSTYQRKFTLEILLKNYLENYSRKECTLEISKPYL